MSEKPDDLVVNLDLSELFDEADDAQIGDEVRQRYATQLDATIRDMTSVREQEDWSDLNDKVVGAEGV